MTTLDFDPDALREKYRAERDKRLRADGNEQYVEVAGEFAHYLDDPYVEPVDARAAVRRGRRASIIGGGFGGLLAGARLREAGVDDIRIIEKGGDFGGTWYWNRYPGAACDVESYIYLPLLEELGYIPKEKYSRRAGDPRAQPQRSASTSTSTQRPVPDRGHRAALGRRRRRAGSSRPTAATRMRARFVCMANGPLHRPEAAGHPRHRDASRATRSTPAAGTTTTPAATPTASLDRLADKRVGIIGTGATAVQCVPHLGAGAKQLYVFQRTPSSIDVRDNRPTDPDWAASLEPGWQQRRMENFNTLVSGGFAERGPGQRRLDRHHRQAAAA